MAETPQEEGICFDSARTPHICSTKWVDSKVEVEGEDTGFARIQGLQRVLCRNFGLINLEELDKNYEKDMYLAFGQAETYCLAVISGKMNVDGTWVPLSKEAVSDRKRRFYAVIQARTVTEAAEHARAGFQVETFSNESVRETKQVDRVGKPALFQGNKENECSSAILKSPAKLDVAFKRRRLQPLSALSLHGCQNLSADLALATVEEPKSNEASPGNSVGTLAYLLTRHHR
ncbi:hypothetical protein L7F22_023545 [Adiantum nelumboides]|nr:hypothetical protein [Adiantum nelumboides]